MLNKQFSSDLTVRKLQYQSFLVEEGAYTYEEVVELSMRELREAVDELLPIMVTSTSVTASGGVSRRVSKVA